MRKATGADIEFVVEVFDSRCRCVAPRDAVRSRICDLSNTGLIRQKWENGVEVFYAVGAFAGAITAHRISELLGTSVLVR